MPKLTHFLRMVASLAFLGASAALATPIQFTYTGVGSGTLNGVPFADSAFRISARADTSNRQSCTFGVCTFVDHGSASIAISGLGTFDLLTSTRTVVSGDVAFFAHAGQLGPNLYDIAADPGLLDEYDLDTSVGPINAFGLLNQWTALPLVNTTGGTLVFNDTVGQESPGSFQATLDTTGGCDNAITLHLDSGGGLSETASPSGIAAFADSAALSRSGGNPWTLIGEWAGTVDPVSCGIHFSDLHLWLGLKNSDDQGTNFDVHVKVLVNNVEAGSKDFICIKGLARNPALAAEISSLLPFAGAPKISGDNDVTVQISARIGTGSSCGGHNSATGLRLYYDSATRGSRLTAIVIGET